MVKDINPSSGDGLPTINWFYTNNAIYFRGDDGINGDELWKGRLPAGGQATPMTYEANGKQYVVIMAGGHGSFGTKMGDALVAYALPDAK